MLERQKMKVEPILLGALSLFVLDTFGAGFDMRSTDRDSLSNSLT